MFTRRFFKSSANIGWLVSALLITSTPSSQAAQTIFFSSQGSSGCVNSYSAAVISTQKVVAHESGTINTINVLIGAGSQTNFSTARYVILADNPSVGSPVVGSPSTTLATFTPDSISGSGANTVAKFVGSFSFNSGTSYWISPLQRASVFPQCYWSANDNSLFNMSSMHVDTSTSTTNFAWRRAYSTVSTSATGANWYTPMHDGIVWQFSLENNTTAPVAALLTSQSGSLVSTYRTITPLVVNVDTQSKVTFYSNGKVIAGCRNILSSSGSATCNWKPSVHGLFRIYAYANPISTSYTPTTTSVINIGVGARTNTR